MSWEFVMMVIGAFVFWAAAAYLVSRMGRK